MKKKVCVAIITATIVTLVGCGSSNNVKNENNSEGISSSSSTAVAETSNVEEISKEASADTKEDLVNTETKDYMGIKFECSSDWGYEETESGATITFEPKEKFVNIIATDTSDMESLENTWNEMAIESVIGYFESVSEREDYTITVAGEERETATCIVGDYSTPVKYTVVSICNEVPGYQYLICYANTDIGENPDDSEFEKFLGSISF